MMNKQPTPVQGQAGVMLLEALIAILVFSLGILSLVALQAVSIKLTGDAKYRTDATLLANRLIGQMWVSNDLSAFATDGDAYNDWLADVAGSDGLLPGVAAADGDVVSTLPTVTVAGDGQVAVTLFWRTPEMPPAERHQYTVVSQIVRNP